ncbi:LacI family DNA-binding transcriptional regulator [Bacillus solimangrovi]|uniref:LacI family transcriptional regulator n=1 Tax=Bacillus solimangrovi TaxID=1305675 RepID=A0A1E5LFZ5_9BACI|nr:LacI family DNA-binding transcriptional regulator [Bacillus solimangrovi]OEH93005.1 LacI family transcriptional regulator [Bacillus solimangrovi]
MTNITDIAKKAGVSRTTVSRVLNNHPYVKPEKRDVVLQTIEDLNYVPNLNAINLSRGRTNIIGVIIPRINHPYFSSLIEGIGEQCHKYDYSLLVYQSHNNLSRELLFFDMLKNKQIDGIIIGSCTLQATALNEMSHFGNIVSCEYSDTSSIAQVFVKHEEGIHMAVDHLRDRGHQKIGLCIGNSRSGVGMSRKKAFFDLQNKHRFIWRDDWYYKDQYTIEDGFQIARNMLGQQERPTALVVGSDQVAAGILYELREQGVSVPGEFAIVGFDNQPISKIAELTTIYQPVQKVGNIAVDLLQKLALQKDVPHVTQLDLQLIKRNTT